MTEATFPKFLTSQKDGVSLAIKLQPRASSNEIGEPVGDELRVRVTAPPVDSAANEALLRLLANTLDCPRGNLELIRGNTSRHKVVKVHGVTAESVLGETPRALNSWIHKIENTGDAAPWLFVAVFAAAAVLMIWRLEAMSADGFEGTVLGTLIMPYCSGIGNLIFALLLARQGGQGGDVLTNALVNNVTNLTLLIGLPAIFWAMKAAPVSGGKPKKRSGAGDQQRVHKFSLLLTLTAALFFLGVVWLLGRDGSLNATDGWVLIGIFLFWQSFHVFEVLKSNARQNKSLGWMLPVNLALLGVGAYATYVSIDWLVAWLGKIHSGFVSAAHLGWLSGWLMVLPNAILAFYYGWRRKPEVVYSSQVGDGHICIPLCIGVFAVQHAITVPTMFQPGIYILAGAITLHMAFVAAFGQLPRFVGILLVAAYVVFVYRGFGN